MKSLKKEQNQGTIYFAANDGVHALDSDLEERWAFEEKDVVALAGAAVVKTPVAN